MIEKTVFISYRRKNVPWALAISQYLTHEGYDVFFDFNSIGSGSFEKVITENIKAKAHFLVLLAPSALERCDDPKDWLRKEIELAMEHKRNIIPVMLEGFDFGAPETLKYLTGRLETLKEYNGLSLPAEYFKAGMQKLCNQFLNVALDTVSHPVSKQTQIFVNKQKLAAAAAEPVSEKTLTAQEWFERAYQAKEAEEQIRLYTQAIELDGMYADAYNNRGIAYRNLNQVELAIEDFDQAIQLNAQDAYAYNNRGNGYAALKDYAQAIEDYDQSIQLNPELEEAYNNRGLSYAALKDYAQAIENYDQAIQLNPQYAAAYNNRGASYASLKDYARSIEDFDQAIQLNPQYVAAYNNRGLSYAALKDYARTIEDFDQAIQLNPEFVEAYNNRGASYAALKDYAQAIENYDQAIQFNPQYATAYNNRGASYADLKDYVRAIVDFDQAIQLNPELAEAYNNRGLSYAALKDYARAIVDYDQAIQLNPQDANAYYNKACAYTLMGKIPETLQWLRDALNRKKEPFCKLAETDSDFDAIREEPAFQQLLDEFCGCE